MLAGPTLPCRHTWSDDGNHFHEQMSAFSFEMFLGYGRGAVIVREEHFRQRPNGVIDARLEWVAQDALDTFRTLHELTSMVNDYDPNVEFVFVTVDADNRGDPLVLRTGENGVTPRDAQARYREAQSMSHWKPGCVLRLDDVLDDVEPGWFVYLWREGVTFCVCRAGENEDGNVCVTEEEHELHADFGEVFRNLRIQVEVL